MACAACFIYSFVARLVAYFIILALLVIITLLLLKCLGDWRERHVGGEEGESTALMSQCYVDKAITISYGACQQDPELGNCSNGSGSSSSSSSCSSNYNSNYSELYDAKICIICYDGPKNCFFVPCGHCATCLVCAQRIFYEENRKCPVCRRFIGKLRRMLNS